MAEPRRKILCIEADQEAASWIAKELNDRGFAVGIALTGWAGFLAILNSRPDLVLCEINLPVMSGVELIEELNQVARHIGRVPFVFIAGSRDRDTELRARRLGADDYIVKPIDFDVLATIIDARLTGIARMRLLPRLVSLNAPELEILTLVARGRTSAQIARQLLMPKRTIDYHIDNARRKLGASTRTAAIVKAAAGGLIKP